MRKEGEIRISSGCAISGIFCRDGRRITGDAIKKSISVMHNRSNGLGGGFAAYGIYPQYRDYFALHIFYDSQSAREDAERFLDRHFDIINLSKIPVRQTARIKDAPLELYMLFCELYVNGSTQENAAEQLGYCTEYVRKRNKQLLEYLQSKSEDGR